MIDQPHPDAVSSPEPSREVDMREVVDPVTGERRFNGRGTGTARDRGGVEWKLTPAELADLNGEPPVSSPVEGVEARAKNVASELHRIVAEQVACFCGDAAQAHKSGWVGMSVASLDETERLVRDLLQSVQTLSASLAEANCQLDVHRSLVRRYEEDCAVLPEDRSVTETVTHLRAALAQALQAEATPATCSLHQQPLIRLCVQCVEGAALAALQEALHAQNLALTLAKQATNGWACYARTNAEHNEITRLHAELDQCLALTRQDEKTP